MLYDETTYPDRTEVAEDYLGEELAAKHGLVGCTLIVIAECNIGLYNADVYRDGQHIGCIEDDGDGGTYYPDCCASNSASFEEGGWCCREEESSNANVE